jgi:hypothetical protein
MGGIEYFPAMDLLEKLQMANASHYREFIMVSVKTSKFGTNDYYVGVPNRALLALFDGFDMVGEAELPKQITTLHAGEVAEIESRFEFAHNSRARLGS